MVDITEISAMMVAVGVYRISIQSPTNPNRHVVSFVCVGIEFLSSSLSEGPCGKVIAEPNKMNNAKSFECGMLGQKRFCRSE